MRDDLKVGWLEKRSGDSSNLNALPVDSWWVTGAAGSSRAGGGEAPGWHADRCGWWQPGLGVGFQGVAPSEGTQ